ncbi:MAG: hypothetical protein ACK56I_13130, partial [bacterium]
SGLGRLGKYTTQGLCGKQPLLWHVSACCAPHGWWWDLHWFPRCLKRYNVPLFRWLRLQRVVYGSDAMALG